MTEPLLVCRRSFEIKNAKGLHARAAAQIVELAKRYLATTTLKLSKEGNTADGNSILGIMTLGVAQEEFLEAEASGPDAEALLDALDELIEEIARSEATS